VVGLKKLENLFLDMGNGPKSLILVAVPAVDEDLLTPGFLVPLSIEKPGPRDP
jgi:hypothetical protein